MITATMFSSRVMLKSHPGLRLRAQGLGFRIEELGFMVQGSGLKGVGCRV